MGGLIPGALFKLTDHMATLNHMAALKIFYLESNSINLFKLRKQQQHISSANMFALSDISGFL